MAEAGKEPDSGSAAGVEDRNPLLDAIGLLLEGIAANAAMHPVCDPEFPGKMRKLKSEIEGAGEPDEALRIANNGVQAMAAYGAAVTKFMQGQRDAMQAQLDHLTKSFGAEPVAPVPAAAAKAETPEPAVGPAPLPPPTKADIDSVSGLPTADRARACIEQAIASGKPIFVALFSVERLDIVNSRFGFAIGDRMLLTFSQHIAQLLSADDQLFRWRGPTFIALLERDRAERLVDSEVLRIAGSRLEYNVNTREHDVLLRITCSHSVLRLNGNSKIEEIIESIDTFSVDRTTRAR